MNASTRATMGSACGKSNEPTANVINNSGNDTKIRIKKIRAYFSCYEILKCVRSVLYYYYFSSFLFPLSLSKNIYHRLSQTHVERVTTHTFLLLFYVFVITFPTVCSPSYSKFKIHCPNGVRSRVSFNKSSKL